MALTVTATTPTPYGTTVPSVYWRWIGLGVDVTTATATVTVAGYVDEAAYTAGKQAVVTRQITLTGAEFATVATQLETPSNGGISAIIYAYLKANVEGFADGVEA